MGIAYTLKGKRLCEVSLETIEEQKARLRNRIQYWKDVKKAAMIPGGKVERWADERIELLERTIREIEEAQRNEEEPEHHMEPAGDADHAHTGA